MIKKLTASIIGLMLLSTVIIMHATSDNGKVGMVSNVANETTPTPKVAPTPPKRISKCGYLPESRLMVYSKSKGGYADFYLASPLIVTILEETTIPMISKDGKQIRVPVYRFSGDYDKPAILCVHPDGKRHPIHYEEYSGGLPKDSKNHFYVLKEEAEACK